MDNLDDSENNAKISDSAYSNSCSNSQSRRSRSSKSTHSGSNSSGSGSSGYGGKTSTLDKYSNNLDQPRTKDGKKKKQAQVETAAAEEQAEAEVRAMDQAPEAVAPEEQPSGEGQGGGLFQTSNAEASSVTLAKSEKGVENMDIATPERSCSQESMTEPSGTCLVHSSANYVTSQHSISCKGFSCVISMHDGVVIYTTSSITTSLGFPKHMWIGRSFIDFVHPRDRNSFASQITNGLAVPKNVNGTLEKGSSTMVCRIRRYRGLTTGFAVKQRSVVYLPFLLKLSFTNDEGKIIYLVIQATQFVSAFKIPKEVVNNGVPFVIRHAANGALEYIDPDSVPYLGYLPQDLADKDALQLYHPDDLNYLLEVYETIVKEGGVPRCKAYRMLAQNGDYVKLETEWSSFINPWSRKLEFVIGKHYILEGPTNPDVFETQCEKSGKLMSAEEKNKISNQRENIVRIMNEVLTKPAEAAKQHMTKRCQDLASFMESLIEDQPKVEEELRLDIQDPDHSYYERDSVMLGGISPHHDYNDSKSSSETLLSYNQLNYNENLQRYFDSHQQCSYEDYNTVTGENILDLKESKPDGTQLSPMEHQSRDSGEMTSLGESAGSAEGAAGLADYLPVRLTESMLNKHNSEMEKALVKLHRENRSICKGDRVKVSTDKKKKKKDLLVRSNSAFQANMAKPTKTKAETKRHGVKRSSKLPEAESTFKHHCTLTNQSRRQLTTRAAPALPSSTITTTVASQPWPATPVQSMNTFLLGVGIPQQMPMTGSVAAVPGMFPLYYSPTPGPMMQSSSYTPGVPSMFSVPSMPSMPTMTSMSSMPSVPSTTDTGRNNSSDPMKQHSVPCMMYGQTLYGSPVMYSPIPLQLSYPIQENLTIQTLQFSNVFDNTMSPINKAREHNNASASKANVSRKSKAFPSLWRDMKRSEPKDEQVSGDSNSSTNNNMSNQECGEDNSGRSKKSKSEIPSSTINTASIKSTDAITDLMSVDGKRLGNHEDKTDGESSYSSFYSSFFKTDSGSAEESGESKKKAHFDQISGNSRYIPDHSKKVVRRKMEPPWMEKVCVTSELVYKYQILTKSLEEVLADDKKKMNNLVQPSLVNEQLGQLYMDLQIDEVAARLVLEEGITSSSSSGEESCGPAKKSKRKREYSKIVFIYEEETPLPSPPSWGEE